ncbi:hypothetical protein DC094_13815 [Pelagibaculum spongiae]|uniref:Uncharacterized protein n=2 Tax=Pelagibaculum spongiae TaxID=2080658 RepID=A0A2V1GZD5_9GAMM|nr:hypothetical protein DC094_13815 [Pelagibaculum spongiae]
MAFLINIENIDFSKESFRLELIKSKPKPLQSMINQRIYEGASIKEKIMGEYRYSVFLGYIFILIESMYASRLSSFLMMNLIEDEDFTFLVSPRNETHSFFILSRKNIILLFEPSLGLSIYEANREGVEEIIKYLIKLESLVKNISFPFFIDEVRYIDKELQERII